ncbi:MAG: cell wall hydrolase [Rhodospirillaceae bacterium]
MVAKNLTQRIRTAFRLCAAPAILGAALLLPAGLPARAADIPADMKIDFSSIIVPKDEMVCLALNDYFEARGESIAGRIAVAKVVLNRSMDKRFPTNICDVVKENHVQDVLHRCQFSWYCDAKADTPYERKQWRTSLKIAAAVLQKDAAIPDPTCGAILYHADFTRPAWTAGYETTTIIGSHIFYRDPDERFHAKIASREPFIYRLNAFAEYTARHGHRSDRMVASAGE